MVLRFIQANRLYDDLVYRFLDKNLKIRFNTLSINKVFPNLVPVFGVSLANPIKEDPSKPNEAAKIEKKLNLSKVEWLSSRKLDGVRTVFLIDGSGEIKTYSREGNEFVTLGVAVAELKKLKLKNMVLDTEACIMRPDGTEDFKRIVSEIKKKAGTIKNPKCFVFDMMTMDEFNSGFSTRSYAQRYEIMKRVIGDRLEPVFHVLEQLPLKDMDQLRRQKAETAEREWEGLILRRADAPYEAKRSNNMLKVKNFSVDEFVVTKAEIGPMRLIDEEKKEYTANVLTNVIIDIGGGNTVSVGTGFDEDERIQFAKYPQLIRGKTIAVQYMGRSCDKNGKPSLRHPSFKGLYGKKRKF
jgi:ATP-dependent DNA ligase